MRVIVTECEVQYFGRGETFLSKGFRVVIIKQDGSVSVHANEGTKPLNYMPAGSTLTVKKFKNHEKWFFVGKKEEIILKIFNITADQTFEVADSNNKLVRFKTEKQLQELLAHNPEPILLSHGEQTTDNIEIHTEYLTAAGAIDLLIHNHSRETTHIVELKRTAMLGAVDQCVRYLSAYSDDVPEQHSGYRIIVSLAAYDIRPNTRAQAERKKVHCVLLEPPT
jgi:endonuclease